MRAPGPDSYSGCELCGSVLIVGDNDADGRAACGKSHRASRPHAVWLPKIGGEIFEKVKYSTLVKIADATKFKKITYNNVMSALCV